MTTELTSRPVGWYPGSEITAETVLSSACESPIAECSIAGGVRSGSGAIFLMDHSIPSPAGCSPWTEPAKANPCHVPPFEESSASAGQSPELADVSSLK